MLAVMYGVEQGRDSLGMFEIYFLGFLLAVLLSMMGFVVWLVRVNTKKMAKLQTDLKTKIESGVELDSQDIVLLGRAYHLSPADSRTALYSIYKDISSPESFRNLKELVSVIHKDEPFDTMPDEVKPSLLRISYLTSNSPEISDKHILTPITNILIKYMEVLEEQKKSKKQTYIAYIFTIVGFFVGLLGLYFAFTAPSAAQIAEQLNQLG